MVWVDWSKGGAGSGLYSREWQPDPVQGYWDPDRFYQPVEQHRGQFSPPPNASPATKR
jgi:hypothetical protein